MHQPGWFQANRRCNREGCPRGRANWRFSPLLQRSSQLLAAVANYYPMGSLKRLFLFRISPQVSRRSQGLILPQRWIPRR
jgi:hypothetical protein